MADGADDGGAGAVRGGRDDRRRGWSERRRDRIMRNRAGLDVREGDRDRSTPRESVGTDFVNVENMRAELFPQEFPEGPYGAPDLALAGGAGEDEEYADEPATLDEIGEADLDGAGGTDDDAPDPALYQADEKGEFSVDAPVEGDAREEEEEPFDPRMVFFFDGA